MGMALHRVALRYKESAFGFGWILLQPVALTLIFTYIRRIADIPSGGVPYPLFVATGLIAWSFTALAISQSAPVIAGNAAMLKRIAIPKIVLPLSVLVASMVDLGVMILLLIGLFIYFQTTLPVTVLWIPFIFMIHLALLCGLTCLISLVYVFLRDVGFAIPSILQLWFFCSSVFYPASMVPEEFKIIARWNPMTGLIESYRSTLLMGQPPPWDLLGPTIITTFLILAFSLICFSWLEGILADLI